MKLTLLALSLLASLASAPARASDVPTMGCLFGATTADLAEKLDEQGRNHALFKGEFLSVHSEDRARGLSALEREMVLAVVTRNGELPTPSWELAAADFTSHDGYLQYFSHDTNGRRWVIVAAYPGDNEYGYVFEIFENAFGETVFEVAAGISDGDFTQCLVFPHL